MSDDFDAIFGALLEEEPAGPEAKAEEAATEPEAPAVRRGPGRRKGETYQKIRRLPGDALKKRGIMLLDTEVAWCIARSGSLAKTVRRLIKEAQWRETEWTNSDE